MSRLLFNIGVKFEYSDYSRDEPPILMLRPAITAQIDADPPSIFEPRFL